MKRACVAIILLAVVLGVAGWYVVRDRYFSPLVSVELRNAAKQPIEEVRLTYKLGTVIVRNIRCGEAKTARFNPGPGESTYSLVIRFRGGKTLKGGGGYVEPGYRMQETITEKRVKTRLTLP